ncbi:O-phosphoserine--tRNA ligase [Methanobacterium paludis]|uniref:O-phosphoserine--tRNA(Cys) ligase n=1 Tax=Methanobacterium paludis (strain DSM 25820 / JCM 18151 / SWAN1) TaxID=868131 RepID=F6D7M6_METPW|nr:O-phosphoserine--tRNA ligase [Methanobacterium paludis]AEG17105.1 O-phosphoseryl-tRNA(Cys) synthetase [Methanobacterium paludis]
MKRKEIVRLAKKDFEKAWVETAKTLKKPHHDDEYPRIHLKTGKSHMLYDAIEELRQAYLKLGFDETVNPLFIDDNHVYRQFGPEAPAVLDRCFYLAGLPRPDIGIGMDKIEKIESLGVELDEAKIQSIQDVFRHYKKGDTSGDDLVQDVSCAIDVSNDLGLRILEKVFPELRELTPVASGTTLRSHMTSGWFITLESLHNKSKLPIKLFSIDRCFRREQREDASHLMTYHSASCVWADDELSLDVGMAVSESLLEHFGFEKFKFLPDEKRSKYYIPETQTEVYGYHPKLREWVEVATFGMYSPIALARYGIDKDVMNLGVGAERIAMILHNQEDVRAMVYSQTYGKWNITDRELATMLRINYYPVSPDGRALMDHLLRTWRQHGDAVSPCEFTAFKGEFMGKNIEVKVVEPEKGTKLLGPASWNAIYIYDGNIIGVPLKSNTEDKLALSAVEKGIPTNISYMDGFAAQAAYKIEEMVVSGTDSTKLRTTISRSISDINLRLDDVALNYITSKNKVIDVRGPIFSTITCEIVE